jgi:hypothetical protein
MLANHAEILCLFWRKFDQPKNHNPEHNPPLARNASPEMLRFAGRDWFRFFEV